MGDSSSSVVTSCDHVDTRSYSNENANFFITYTNLTTTTFLSMMESGRDISLRQI